MYINLFGNGEARKDLAAEQCSQSTLEFEMQFISAFAVLDVHNSFERERDRSHFFRKVGSRK